MTGTRVRPRPRNPTKLRVDPSLCFPVRLTPAAGGAFRLRRLDGRRIAGEHRPAIAPELLGIDPAAAVVGVAYVDAECRIGLLTIAGRAA
jgi:hypothetical protein